MYTVEINWEDEVGNSVEINFKEGYDFIIDKGNEHNDSFRYAIDYFEDVVRTFINRFPKLEDCVDVIEDNRYSVTCETNEEAQNVEAWFDEHMGNAESIVNDIIEAYEHNMELEEEFKEGII